MIYDYLVHPSILKHAPQARLIYVGKKGGDLNSTLQDSIESLMLQLVRKGKRVVRLKGGDPFVFGRGGEEALFLAERSFLREIEGGCQVPAGISSRQENGVLTLTGGIFSPTQNREVRKTMSGAVSEAETLGKKLADSILKSGGAEILKEIKHGKI